MIAERYRSAVHSRSLTVDERTTFSDTDVLGAMGLADRALTTGKRWSHDLDANGKPREESVKPTPLAVALERLFAGDARAAAGIIEALAALGYARSQIVRVKITKLEARDMASICLRWHQNPACRPCNGHGYELIPGTPTIGDSACGACGGTGKSPIEKAVDPEGDQPGRREIMRWMVSEMERSTAIAGAAAMRSIAARMNF